MLELEFMRFAFIAGFLASVVFGIIGTYVVVKRIVFISGGIAHASFGGVGLAVYLGMDPILGATVFALASALGIGMLSKKTLLREDTTIGILWAIGMALGAFFIFITPGYGVNASSFLFGNILMLTATDLFLLGGLSILTLGSTILLYNRFQAMSFDEEFANVVGVSTLPLYLFMLALVALTVVFLIKFVGIILVIAMLTIPASIVSQFTHDLRKIMFFSALLSGVLIMTGLWMAYVFDFIPGATIVLLSGTVFIVVTALKRFADSGKKKPDDATGA